MTPHLAKIIVHACVLLMTFTGFYGLLHVYIDMNDNEKTRKCLAELIGTIAILFLLLVTILIIQTRDL